MNKCFAQWISSPLIERLFILLVPLHIKVTCDF
uniref:Uncharacterized protein n=1 Tax=Lepeophtheirus salmonis TaxID=72036 RepID=A0A0K2UMH6_LEPSM